MVRRYFWGLALILILALAGMGVAYGLWYEDLYIFGTVSTGVLDVELIAGEEFDVEEKDFGTCVADVVDGVLTIDVDNAYPSYECWVPFEVWNTGTIPVHLTPLEWWDGANGELEPFELVEFVDCFDNIQVHPGEFEACTLLIHFDNEDGLAMGEDYFFAYRFMAHQYNEEPNGNGNGDR